MSPVFSFLFYNRYNHEGNVLLRDSFAYAIGKGDVLFRGCFTYATGESSVLYLRTQLVRQRAVLDCFCTVLVRATRCCVTVFACASGRGNLLLCFTIMKVLRVPGYYL